MARTPRYNDGSEGFTESSRGEQIANPGRGVSVESLGVALEPALLDPRGAVAIGRGNAALGEGISRLAQPFIDLAERQAKMINANRVMEAQKIMDAAEAEFEAERINEGDETKWIEMAAQKASKTREAISKLNLSQAASDEVDSRYDAWTTGLDGRTRVASSQKTRSDFRNNWMGDYEYAVNTGNQERADKAVDILKDSGVLTDGEAGALKQKAVEGIKTVQNKQKALALDAYKAEVIQVSTTTPPAEVRAFIENDYANHGYTPEEKQYLIGVSEQVARDKTSEMSGVVTDGIVTGNIWNEYELDATVGQSPFMTPTLRKKYTDMIESYNKDVEQGVVEQKKQARAGNSGTKAFYQAYHDALSWKPDMKSEEAPVELADKLAWVKENVRDDLQGEVTTILHQKFGVTGSGGKPTKDSPIDKVITNRIGDVYSTEMKKVDAQLELKIGKKNAPESDAEVISLRRKKDDLVEMQARVKEGMDSFYESKGGVENVTREQAVKHLNTLIPAEKAILDADSIMGNEGETGPVGAAGTLGSGLIDMVKGLEGFNPNAYGDFKQTSIGYGTRGKKGETIDEKEGDRRLREELSMHASRIDEAAANGGYQLTDKQRDALISFDFNTGSGAYLLNTAGGDLSEIVRRMKQYRIAGGKVNQGLVNRRAKEAGIFAEDL